MKNHKVLLVNGSPNEHGCTYTALTEVARGLESNGVKTQIFHVGREITGCTACGACKKTKTCVIDDRVNEFAKLAETADGFVFGSPTYYAGPSGQMCSFMDRLFFAHGRRLFPHKPAAVVASARRAGTTATLDRLTKYPSLVQMPIITSAYWNMVHGNTPDEVRQDIEGMQTMRILGANMAYFIKSIKKAKITPPAPEEKIWFNFIRAESGTWDSK